MRPKGNQRYSYLQGCVSCAPVMMQYAEEVALVYFIVCRYDETVASFANAAGVGLGDTLIGGAEGAPQVRMQQ